MLPFVATGCQDAPLLAPSSATITLSVAASTLPANGSVEVTAYVFQGGSAPVHDGTTVYFASTLGTFDQKEALTTGGRATTRFLAGTQSGEAEITALSGNATLTASVKVKIGGAAINKVVLAANPGSVPATGGTVSLIAIVTDTNGDPLPGVAVSFTATAGIVADPVVNTALSGEARSTLQTDRETTVTATAGAQSATATIKATAAPTVTITVKTATPIVNAATVFEVAVSVAADGSPVKSVTVNFGDGDRADLGNLSATTSVSHVYRAAGTHQVTATVQDVTGQQATTSSVLYVAAAAPLDVKVTGPTQPVAVGAPAQIIVTVTGSPAIKSYTYDFGDGSGLLTTTGSQTQHVYTTSGIKTVQVTVVALDGNTGIGQTQVSVQ